MSKFVLKTDVGPSAYAAPDLACCHDGIREAAEWFEAANRQCSVLRRGARPIGFELPRPCDVEAREIIRKIRALARDEEPDDGIFVIYTEVDALLRRGAFDVCDRILSETFDDFPAVFLLALLSITSSAATMLEQRTAFAQRVRNRLSRDDGARVDELLSGLE